VPINSRANADLGAVTIPRYILPNEETRYLPFLGVPKPRDVLIWPKC